MRKAIALVIFSLFVAISAMYVAFQLIIAASFEAYIAAPICGVIFAVDIIMFDRKFRAR